MNVGIETPFTSALGLQAPWVVESVKLDPAKRRLDFEVTCQQARLACPACGAAGQSVHDRLRRSWRHLDFFQFEAWLHADVPRVHCAACGKTSQIPVPWAREGSSFTLVFEALALSMCQGLPVRQAAQMLRISDKQAWRQIRHNAGRPAPHLRAGSGLLQALRPCWAPAGSPGGAGRPSA